MRLVLVVMMSFYSWRLSPARMAKAGLFPGKQPPCLLDMKRPALPRSGASTGIPNGYPASQNFHQDRLVPAGGISDLESM